MALPLRIHLQSPNSLPQSSKFQSYPNRPRTLIIRATSSGGGDNCSISISDSELASDLAKINTHLLHKEEAMKKSKELLFTDLCRFLELEEEQAKSKWSRIDEDEKWDLVKGFVSSEWGVDFHPLSTRSAMELIEEHLRQEKQKQPSSSPSSTSGSSSLFSGLKRLLS